MGEVDQRSARIVFDLQACQTLGSAHRGVGRYSKLLFEAMLQISAPRQLFGVVSAQHAHWPEFTSLPASRLLEAPPLPEWQTERDFRGGEQDSLDAILHSAIAATVSPDIVHVSHIFEGFGDRVAIPDPTIRPAGQLFSATLYDLIPLRFKDHYFQGADFERWYRHRLKYLHQADLLLAISESTRQDAIGLLGLDPAKIVTIHGGIADHFKPVPDRDAARAQLRAKYALQRPGIVLYTGGDDHRKNLTGAIEAYAALSPALRNAHQLVVICTIEKQRKELLYSIAQKFGLSREEVYFLGFVPEVDLVAFYAACDVFFFPSLYEGLGLPVIEAMASGAPVISGDNSSLRELVDRKDALFDAASPDSIVERLSFVLENQSFADDLRQTGLARAKEFSWQKSANLALNAFDEALARKRHTGIQAALNGWLPRPRLAILTPLPPCRSGIADYNAKFLPHLDAHFDIDLYVDGYRVSDERLNAAFRIFDAVDFRDRAASYDAILYEFGNSEFHAYMLPLLAEFPGIVGLHDAFLSGLMGYLEFHLGDAGRYGREMLYSHGGQARRLMAPVQANPDPIGAAIVDLPSTKSVIDHAIGIISHSPFNLDMARERYPEGWPAPYRIIPQMVPMVEQWSVTQRARARAELGFCSDDFIVATYGHVAWTKWGDRLLSAFLQSDFTSDAKCYLVFAGELAKDDFGLKLNDAIRKSGFSQRIRVTGFLSENDYERYLRVADVAVQLRTKSRGGTPKAVLDCLAHGLPVLVNNDASYQDYPDNVVVKLSADPSIYEISTTLLEIRNDQTRRQGFAQRGLSYVREWHDAERCAAQYAATIHEFIDRDAARKAGSYAHNLAPHLVMLSDPVGGAKQAADFLDSRRVPSFARPRLIIDASHIAQDDHKTGIPRVVREIVRSAYCRARAGFEAIAAERVGDQIFPALKWLEQQRLMLPHEIVADRNDPLVFNPGDHLLMLDSSWAAYDQFEPVFAAARAARVPITTAVYDLLPITLPPENIVKGGREWFEGWLRRAIASSDGLICISRSVADDVIDYIEKNRLGKPGLKVGWWHLGSTSFVSGELPDARFVRDAVNTPYALMVGTIEPRKNHELALDAFEKLWADGSNLNLVIAGKPGWLVDHLMERLRTHPLRNTRLFLLEKTSDLEIQHIYRHAAVLLMISKGEGFGLPLVEAAQYDVPIICSNIAAFREIAGEHATYVNTKSPDALFHDLGAAWRSVQAGTAPRSSAISFLSWEDSTDALLKVVLDQDWYWKQ
jgi:glycosyltransferase involved in cell wall biosynthesis